MYAGYPPFLIASREDDNYKFFYQNRVDLFWAMHEKNMPDGFFTEEFKDIITHMLQIKPVLRPDVGDLLGHPWV